jgi:hypothetical protein
MNVMKGALLATLGAGRAVAVGAPLHNRRPAALEVRASTSQGSINRGGHYQEGVEALEIHLEDRARFPAGWAFFAFDRADQKLARPFPPASRCHDCHAAHDAVDETFV